MKILKLSFIVICMLIHNTNNGLLQNQDLSTRLTIPKYASVIEPQIVQRNVCNQEQDCFCLITPNSEAHEKVKQLNKNDVAQLPGSIIFPINGTQPTTEEAIIFSNANVQNDCITNWYMQMFGLIPYNSYSNPNNDYIEAGYDKNNNKCRLIDVVQSSSEASCNLLQFQSMGNAFLQTFQVISSTSPGRVLLYRILIEARRTNGITGCMEKPLMEKLSEKEISFLQYRNSCRRISIEWYGYGNSFSINGPFIRFGVQFPYLRVPTIGSITDDYATIVLYPKTNDTGLIHEIIHWYHSLRDISRVVSETQAEKCTYLINQTDLGKYYWGILDGDNIRAKYSSIPWVRDYQYYLKGEQKNEKNVRHKYTANFEEIRTILGSQKNIIDNYLEGDDISENLYRANTNQPLRFGHSLHTFYEDSRVVNKAISITLSNLKKYSIDKQIKQLRDEDLIHLSPAEKPRDQYNNVQNKRGLGNYQIGEFILDELM